MKSQIPVAVAMVVGLTIVACGTDRPTQHYSGVNQAAGPVPNPPEAPKPANILHFYDFQGHELSTMPAIPEVKKFAISNTLIAYTDSSNALHLLDQAGQALPGFKPIPNVPDFAISD